MFSLRPALICDTIALEATLESVVVFGMLVLMRTFSSWALVVESEGRWPWQPVREECAAAGPQVCARGDEAG